MSVRAGGPGVLRKIPVRGRRLGRRPAARALVGDDPADRSPARRTRSGLPAEFDVV
jgi:hypothetical protein